MAKATRCTNCGDPARIGGSTVPDRARLGYCVGCFNAFQQAQREERLARNGYPPDMRGRNPYPSRPGHPADDSP